MATRDGRGKAIGYVRVSTDAQGSTGHSTHGQAQRMREMCHEVGLRLIEIVTEVESSTKERELFNQVQERLENDEARCLVCAKIDRMGRNQFHLASIVRWAEEQRTDIISVDEGWMVKDGQMVDKMLPFRIAMAQVELTTIRERTKQGLAAARAKGVRLGHPVENDDLSRRIYEMRQAGMTLEQVENLTAARVTVHGHPAGRADVELGQRNVGHAHVDLVGQHLDGERSIALRARLGLAGRTRAQHTLGRILRLDHELARLLLEREWKYDLGTRLDPFHGPTRGCLLHARRQPSRSGLSARQDLGRSHPPCRPYLHLDFQLARSIQPVSQRLLKASMHVGSIFLQGLLDHLCGSLRLASRRLRRAGQCGGCQRRRCDQQNSDGRGPRATRSLWSRVLHSCPGAFRSTNASEFPSGLKVTVHHKRFAPVSR